jgi:aldehyde dehydrogenase (NAD+)
MPTPSDALASVASRFHLPTKGDLAVRSPIDGERLASVPTTPITHVDRFVDHARSGFASWRNVPGPQRGELVRRFGHALRTHKADLATLVTLECGKPISEAEGEVQEMIDICDFAVGLSRQLYGLTMPSERPGHHLREAWQPLGPVLVISAFNFPVAVWAWNAAIALVCGNPVVWKPSEKTPLTALACTHIFDETAKTYEADTGHDTSYLCQTAIGGRELGQAFVDHRGVPLVSATGSVPMGRAVAQRVAARLGRCLLELGGNNAMIVRPSADLDLAARAVVFSAAGTAGQRCTTLRRLIVHPDVKQPLVERVTKAYRSLKVGNPLDRSSHLGPLIDSRSFDAVHGRIGVAEAAGGHLLVGGDRVNVPGCDGGHYVAPAIVDMPEQAPCVHEECFGPLMYVLTEADLDAAITLQNAVPQGLSSCIFTTDVRESERFLSATGSDCGIANVNIGPSGAEIGGAFGGEKDTGGGRESGSDAWKAYMRRQTQTVNYSTELPLAQGVTFDV